MNRSITARREAVPLLRRGGRPGPDRRNWVIRPDDLLVLAFDLVNLQVKASNGGAPAQLARKGPGQAFLIVWFPPQHIIEKAYFTTFPNYPVSAPSNPGPEPPRTDPDATTSDETLNPAPIDAIVAGWSRLVFYVPDDKLPIDWTLPGLLSAMRDLELSVPANALPPKEPHLFIKNIVASSLMEGFTDIKSPASRVAVTSEPFLPR